MSRFTKEVVSAAAAVGVTIHQIGAEDAQSIWRTFNLRFAAQNGAWIWERISVDCAFIYDGDKQEEILRWPGEYVGSCEVFLGQEGDVFLFTSGNELTQVLDEWSGNEFTVFDRSFSYGFIHSHEQMLYAVGDAKEWLDKKKQNLTT